MENKETTGEKIKRIRISKKLTQKELAKKCDMYESQIRKYELGKANPKIATLQKIAAALEVPVNTIRSDRDLEFDTLYQALNAWIDSSNKQIEMEQTLVNTYRKLNESGQKKALNQVEMLSKIPEYRKDNE